jgi:hypothetical protein
MSLMDLEGGFGTGTRGDPSSLSPGAPRTNEYFLNNRGQFFIIFRSGYSKNSVPGSPHTRRRSEIRPLARRSPANGHRDDRYAGLPFNREPVYNVRLVNAAASGVLAT